jgi:Zn-dependent protease
VTTTVEPQTGPALRCAGCGTAIAPGLASCPACHRLVHAARLRELADEAAAAKAAGDVSRELAAWRESLDLLPRDSRQFAAIGEKIAALSHAAEETSGQVPAPPSSGPWKWVAGLGPLGLLLWKFKFLILAVAGKGKLLLLGLTQMSTLFSMFLSMGVYWTIWGLPFAVGFVVSIYIHEIGHVAALRRYGVPASAPMFIPGFGAVIRSRQGPATPRENARVGLAGPIWGLGAALAASLASVAGGGALFTAIARTGAWVNLFNLMPVWQLDGNRGFASLTRLHRWIAVLALVSAWLVTGDGLLVLLCLVSMVRAMANDAPLLPDRGALLRYVGVTLALAVVFRFSA